MSALKMYVIIIRVYGEGGGEKSREGGREGETGREREGGERFFIYEGDS